MKLFVINPKTKSKHYLRHRSPNRRALAEALGSRSFRLGKVVYEVSDVKAEYSDNTASAMAAGGVIGVAGGVPGVVLGGIIGAFLGKTAGNGDKAKADAFNQSKL